MLEGETAASLGEDAGVDDFPDRIDEVGDGKAGHRRDLAERELAGERGGHGHHPRTRRSTARQAPSHAVLEPVRDPVLRQPCPAVDHRDQVLLAQASQQINDEEGVALHAGQGPEEVTAGRGSQYVRRHLRDRRGAERCQADRRGPGGGQLGQRPADLRYSLVRPDRDQPRDRQRRQPLRQHAQGEATSRVRPLHVIEAHQQRLPERRAFHQGLHILEQPERLLAGAVA